MPENLPGRPANYFISVRKAHGIVCLFIALGTPFDSVAAQTTLAAVARLVTLREVLDSVRANSPTLGAGRARVRSAEGGLSSARTWSNPVLSFDNQKMSDQGPGIPASRETMTTAMLPLEPLYQRGPRIQRAEALIKATGADLLAQRQQVAMNAADAFYRTALARVNVDATRSLSEWLDTVVAYNSVRVREGAAAEADLIRSELERDHVLNELAMSESELARAQASLTVFIGRQSPANPISVEVDSLPLDSLTVTQPGHLLLHALSLGGASPTVPTVSRPEVEAARQRVVASEAASAAESRMLLREVGAMVGTKNSGGSSSLVAGFTVPLPILDQNRGSIASARADRDAARFDLAQEKRRAEADLSGAESAANILSDRVASFGTGKASYLARADEARRIALGAYREGGTTLLQVIDAARAWREARSSYFETLFAQHRAIIGLLVSQGIDVIDSWPRIRAGGGQ